MLSAVHSLGCLEYVLSLMYHSKGGGVEEKREHMGGVWKKTKDQRDGEGDKREYLINVISDQSIA